MILHFEDFLLYSKFSFFFYRMLPALIYWEAIARFRLYVFLSDITPLKNKHYLLIEDIIIAGLTKISIFAKDQFLSSGCINV